MHVNEKKVIVGSTRHDAESAFREGCCERARINNYLLLIRAELGFCSFLQADSLCRNDVFEGTTLHSWECDSVEIFRVFFTAENESSAWTAQSLVRGGRNKIGVGHRARMNSRSDESCNVRHIDKEKSAAALRNLRDAREVDDS